MRCDCVHRIEKLDITLTSCCIKLSGEGAEKLSQEIELKIWFNSLVYPPLRRLGGKLDCKLESPPYISLSGDGVDGRVIICLSLRSRLRGLYVPPPPFSLFHNSWVFKNNHKSPFPRSIIILVKLGICDLVIRLALMEKRMIKMLMARMEMQVITRGT